MSSSYKYLENKSFTVLSSLLLHCSSKWSHLLFLGPLLVTFGTLKFYSLCCNSQVLAFLNFLPTLLSNSSFRQLIDKRLVENSLFEPLHGQSICCQPSFVYESISGYRNVNWNHLSPEIQNTYFIVSWFWFLLMKYCANAFLVPLWVAFIFLSFSETYILFSFSSIFHRNIFKCAQPPSYLLNN